MPSAFARAVFFLSGYLPLFLIFTIQFFPDYRYWALIPLAVGVIAAIGLLAFMRWVQTSEARPIEIQSVQRKDAEVIAYIFAYVFPFLGLDIEDASSALGLGVFFMVLMVLNVSSNMIHINPVLNLLGYHLYEVTLAEGDAHTLITRRSRLVRGTQLESVIVGDDISMEKRHGRNR